MQPIKTAKLSSRGQLVIPQSIRETLGLESEDEMVITVQGNHIIMRKLDLSDVLEDAKNAFDQGETLSQDDVKKRYGLK